MVKLLLSWTVCYVRSGMPAGFGLAYFGQNELNRYKNKSKTM